MPRDEFEIRSIRTSNRFYIRGRPKVGLTGQGEVLFCEREKDGKVYALKRPRGDHWKSYPNQVIDFFQKEALVWIVLGKHKNIVQAFWFDLDERYRPYIVMEYVEGDRYRDVSLGDRLKRGGMIEQSHAVAIALETIDGLAYAKRVVNSELNQPFAHKDIKPDNLLMTGDGRVKVTDFGLVQRHKGGTPKYQSPEQWEGEEAVEEKTDVYGLGCVLFEMIEGEPLFKGLTHHLEVQHLYEEPRRATSADPELAEVISSCLCKSPDDRPGFSPLRERLEFIYKRLTGKAFPSPDDAVGFSADEINARGAGFDELGRYDKALECYDEAIEKEPSDFRFYLNRANAHLSLNNYEEAQADYKRAMQIVPETVEAYLGQGALLAKLKNFKDAISCFNKGLSLNNREPLFYVSLGNLYGQMGRCHEAEFHFRKALALNLNQAEAHLGLGNIHLLKGEYREAKIEHEKALKLNPFYAQHIRPDK